MLRFRHLLGHTEACAKELLSQQRDNGLGLIIYAATLSACFAALQWMQCLQAKKLPVALNILCPWHLQLGFGKFHRAR